MSLAFVNLYSSPPDLCCAAVETVNLVLNVFVSVLEE